MSGIELIAAKILENTVAAADQEMDDLADMMTTDTGDLLMYSEMTAVVKNAAGVSGRFKLNYSVTDTSIANLKSMIAQYTGGMSNIIAASNYSTVDKVRSPVLFEYVTPTSEFGSGTFYPTVSGDDGYAEGSNWIFNSGGSVALIGRNTGPRDCRAWIKFDSVTIPQGATINTAFVRVTAGNTNMGSICYAIMSYGDIDDAVAPVNEAQLDDAIRTTVMPNWPIPDWTAGIEYDLGDSASSLQEVIDRGGWSSGNSVIFYSIENGNSSIGAIRRFNTVDTVNVPELHVTWEA